MEWNNMPPSVLATMGWLGNFSPTADAAAREMKGCMLDIDEGGPSKVYIDSNDLREMSAHFVAVADWLDERAKSNGQRST